MSGAFDASSSSQDPCVVALASEFGQRSLVEDSTSGDR